MSFESSALLPSANVLSATGMFDPEVALTDLELPDGRVFRVPTSLLVEEVAAAAPDAPGSVVIPLLEERLEVTRRVVETGKVRLHKTVQSYDAVLDEALAVRSYDVERVILNVPVETAPGVRTEGETTIYPLVEEQLVLTRQLVLKEEVRVTRRETERRDTRSVTLRRERLEVEREELLP